MKKVLMAIAVAICLAPSTALASFDEPAVEIPIVVAPSLSSVMSHDVSSECGDIAP